MRADGPPRHRVAVVTWLGIYPTITLVLATVESLGLRSLALPLRTLAVTLVVVPTMVFVVAPALTRLFAGWLRADRSAPC
jgi:uncharacterized protein